MFFATLAWLQRGKKVQNFDERFTRAFQEGLSDIKFFVRIDECATVEKLKSDALKFQEAIDSQNFTSVEAVD